MSDMADPQINDQHQNGFNTPSKSNMDYKVTRVQSEPKSRLSYSKSMGAGHIRKNSILKKSNSDSNLMKSNRVRFGENDYQEFVSPPSSDKPQEPHATQRPVIFQMGQPVMPTSPQSDSPRRSQQLYTDHKIQDKVVFSAEIKTTEVRQDLSHQHYFGNTTSVTAVLKRESLSVPLGLSLLSPLESEHVSRNMRGVRVGGISAGSIAAKDDLIHIGDRILSINGITVEEDSHFQVVETLAKKLGNITFELSRPVVVINNGPILRSGVGSLKKKMKRLSFSKRQRLSRPKVDMSSAKTILVHRHPNTSGFQFGVEGGFEGDNFPSVITATHPRSPFTPLTEGGELGNNYELLAVGDTPTVGLRHNEVIELLKAAGEEVAVTVLPPVIIAGKYNPRHITDLFKHPANNAKTKLFCESVRETMYKWIKPVTTRPCKDELEKEKYCFASVSDFKKAAKSDGFIEWIQHTSGDFYGIPKPFKADKMSKSKAQMFVVDPSSPMVSSAGGSDGRSIEAQFLDRKLSESMLNLFGRGNGKTDAVEEENAIDLDNETNATTTTTTTTSTPTNMTPNSEEPDVEVIPMGDLTGVRVSPIPFPLIVNLDKDHHEDYNELKEQDDNTSNDMLNSPTPSTTSSTSLNGIRDPNQQTQLQSSLLAKLRQLETGLNFIKQLANDGGQIGIECDTLLEIVGDTSQQLDSVESRQLQLPQRIQSTKRTSIL